MLVRSHASAIVIIVNSPRSLGRCCWLRILVYIDNTLFYTSQWPASRILNLNGVALINIVVVLEKIISNFIDYLAIYYMGTDTIISAKL